MREIVIQEEPRRRDTRDPHDAKNRSAWAPLPNQAPSGAGADLEAFAGRQAFDPEDLVGSSSSQNAVPAFVTRHLGVGEEVLEFGGGGESQRLEPVTGAPVSKPNPVADAGGIEFFALRLLAKGVPGRIARFHSAPTELLAAEGQRSSVRRERDHAFAGSELEASLWADVHDTGGISGCGDSWGERDGGARPGSQRFDQTEIGVESELPELPHENAALERARQGVERLAPAGAALQPGVGGAGDEVILGGKQFHGASGDGSDPGLVAAFEEWQQFVADAVAEEIQRGVAAVGPGPQSMCAGVGGEVRSGEGEQGSGDLDIGVGGRRAERPHASQTFGTSAAQPAEEEEFDLVIGVMGEGDALGAGFASRAGEEGVTELAGGHLDGEVFPAGDGGDVGRVDNAGELEAPGEALDPGGVGVAGVAAQAVVEVGDDQPPSMARGEGGEGVEEDERIKAAGDADDERVCLVQEALVLDCLVDEFGQRRHGAMLRRRFAPCKESFRAGSDGCGRTGAG